MITSDSTIGAPSCLDAFEPETLGVDDSTCKICGKLSFSDIDTPETDVCEDEVCACLADLDVTDELFWLLSIVPAAQKGELNAKIQRYMTALATAKETML